MARLRWTSLCDPANEASLSALADQLYEFDPNTDTTGLQNQLDAVQSNIDQLDLSPEQEPLGAAAAAGIGQLEVALADPQTAGGVATTAADSLVAFDGAICLP